MSPDSKSHLSRYSSLQYTATLRCGTVLRVQYVTVQYTTVQYSTIQYSAVQNSTMQCHAVQYSTVQSITTQLLGRSHPLPGAVPQTFLLYATAHYCALLCSTLQYTTEQCDTAFLSVCSSCSLVVEALRPGVFALISACSPEDLQFLHAAFGQGMTQTLLKNSTAPACSCAVFCCAVVFCAALPCTAQ